MEINHTEDKDYSLLWNRVETFLKTKAKGKQDITERKRAEEALLKAHDELERRVKERTHELEESLGKESILADLIRNASLAIGVGYPDGRMGIVNQAFEKLTGYTEDELKKIKWNEVLTPLEWMRHEAAQLEELVRTRQPVKYEKEYLRKDGSRVPVEIVAHPRFDADDNLEFYYGFVTDLTERRKTEEALQKAHNELEQRVAERTAELSRVNFQMEQEIKERSFAEEALRQGEAELRKHKVELEETNVALKILLKKTKEDNKQIEEQVMLNVKELVEPYIEKLKKCELAEKPTRYLEVLESNINEIVSPFIHSASIMNFKLTPSEIHVANLVKQGKRTKEIAAIMHLSPDTINVYRRKIRKKIGITNKKTNLRSMLLSLKESD